MGQRRRPVEGVVMDPAFWNGKRVFVTGHTGFKGAWLSLMLEPLGAHVTGYSLPPPGGRPGRTRRYAICEVYRG